MNKGEIKYLIIVLCSSVVFISVYSIEAFTTKISISNTTVWWIFNISILTSFYIYKIKFYKTNDAIYLNFLTYYLLWNFICIIRGAFVADNYWDWKGLMGNTISLLLPLISYVATNVMLTKKILKSYFKVALPLFAVICLFITTDAYGFYLAPIAFFMLFFPILKNKTKILVSILTVFIMTIDLGARSNVIKFAVPILFMISYYFKSTISVYLLEICRKILFITPFLLLTLGVSGIFNVFNIKKYSNIEVTSTRVDAKGDLNEEDISVDTRTFLYEEVLSSAKKHKYWWLGRTPARGNDTDYFDLDFLSGRSERLGNEVGILNVFTWTGIVGVILLFLVFYFSTYISLHHSNNFFSKIFSLYIAFRWVYLWVEDINNFSLNMFTLWLLIGLMNSYKFREMTDEEVKIWVNDIFSFKKDNKPVEKYS